MGVLLLASLLASVWKAEIFRSSDAAGLNNNRLSFYLLMTCLNGYTSLPNGNSLAELLFSSERGAIVVWTSSGITRAANQFAASQSFINLGFNAAGKSLHIGEIVQAVKPPTADPDVRRT